jgi:hypothetical protein
MAEIWPADAVIPAATNHLSGIDQSRIVWFSDDNAKRPSGEKTT